MNAYLEIIRVGNAIMAVIAVVLMGIIGQNFDVPLILGIVAVFLATGGGNAINDYFDYKIDLINKPKRPIPSGRISLKNGRNYAFALFTIAIVLGFVISYLVNSLYPALIVFLSSLLMYYYAHTLKSLPLIGNIAISILTGLCFVFGGVIIGLDTANFLIIQISFFLGFFAVFMTMAREITKDMEDVEGDELEGAKTFPIVYGNKVSSILASALIIITSVLSPILYFNEIFKVYYLFVVAIAIVIFFYSAYTILKDQSPENCKNVSKLIKIGMMIAFLSFAIGSF